VTDGIVADASAMLALLQGEPGVDVMAMALGVACMSAVNWAEVVQKARAHGIDVSGLQQELQDLGVEFVAFGTTEAEIAADLWHRGLRTLSLGDRACLATAIARGLPVMTADRAWAGLTVEVAVRIVR
jgi:PIN domain nuclease of toxin-antitoxin system